MGRYAADTSLWTAIAGLLATCNISPSKDERGQDIIPPVVLGASLSVMYVALKRSAGTRTDTRPETFSRRSPSMLHPVRRLLCARWKRRGSRMLLLDLGNLWTTRLLAIEDC